LLLRVFSKLSKLLSFFLIQLFNATGTYQTYYHLFIIQSFWLFLFFKIDAEIIIISFFVIHSFWLFHIATRSYQNYYHLFYYSLFSIIFLLQKNQYWNCYHLFFLLSTLFDFSCQNHKGVLKFFFTVEVPAQLAC